MYAAGRAFVPTQEKKIENFKKNPGILGFDGEFPLTPPNVKL